EDLVASIAPIVHAALARGTTVVTATTPSVTEILSRGLGDAARRIDMLRATKWRTNPYHHLQALRRLVEDLPEGGSLLVIAQPVWEGSGAALRQWARYESILNVALADAPLWLVCIYDRDSLPPFVLEFAGSVHLD